MIEEEQLLANGETVGERIKAGLKQLGAKHATFVGDVRGSGTNMSFVRCHSSTPCLIITGMALAIEMVENPDTKQPSAEKAALIQAGMSHRCNR